MFKSLNTKIFFTNVQHKKRPAQHLRRMQAQPEKYQKVTQLKPFNFNNPQQSYPVKLTIKERYVYKPMKTL